MVTVSLINIISDFLSAIVSSKILLESSKKRKEEDSVATRFVQLFESHGVHRNQIPRIFKHGLSVADVANDEKLLEKLTEEMQVDACSLFAVQREWLDGANNQIYPTYHFYKYPEGFIKFIDNIIQKSESRDIKAILLTPVGNQYGKPALLLLEEELGAIGEKSYYRYYQLSSEWI